MLEVNAVDVPQDSQKRFIILAFEQLRSHLRKLYDESEDNNPRPPLQYIVLLDLKQLSIQSIVSSPSTIRLASSHADATSRILISLLGP